MHTLAEFVPAAGPNQKKWVDLLVALRTSLPCPDCTWHYTRWCATHPFVRRVGVMMMARRVVADIREWLLNLHNDVNRRKGVTGWDAARVSAAFGGDRDMRVTAVRAAIDAIRGLIGGPALQALDTLVAGM
jgi:hypothetical protein